MARPLLGDDAAARTVAGDEWRTEPGWRQSPHSPRALQRVCHETAQRAGRKGQGDILAVGGSVCPALARQGGGRPGTTGVHRAFVL